KADDDTTTHGLPAQLPAWGGDDPSRWSPEAILANAVTPELQRDPAARVSIATALSRSTYAPFGDGQTDAAVSPGTWQGVRPPVIGVRHATPLTVRRDRALPIGDPTIELWNAGGGWVASAIGTRTADGDLEIDVADPDQLAALGDRLAVSPRGWRDGFG